MNYARRFSLRLARCISLCLCGAVVLTSFAIAPNTRASKERPIDAHATKVRNGGQSDKAKKVTPAPPQPGPPFPNLPNLDEIRKRPREVPRAPLPIPSTLRSRRKPLRVGGVNSSSTSQATVNVPVPERFRDTRGASNIEAGRLHHSRITTPPSPAENSSYSFAPPPIGAPTNLTVTAVSSTHVQLSWTASSGVVDHYQIERSTSLAGIFAPIGNSAITSFDDATVANLHSYLYRVRAIDVLGGQSGPSNMVFGTAITFTDPQLVANQTLIKEQHLYDLRDSVKAVRALVPGMSAPTWTQNDLHNAFIYGNDVQELRNQLNDALASLRVPVSPYDDPQLISNVTPIRKIHIEQLRDRSTSGILVNSSQARSQSSLARMDLFNQPGFSTPISSLTTTTRAGLSPIQLTSKILTGMRRARQITIRQCSTTSTSAQRLELKGRRRRASHKA